MNEHALLFLLGVFTMMALMRLFGWLRADDPTGRFWRPVLRGVGVTLVLIISGVTLQDALEQHYSFGPYMFASWIALGDGSAVFGGLIAGMVIDSALHARWVRGANVTGLALFGGGTILLLIFFLALSDPAIFRRIGLSGVSAGQVSLTFTPVKQFGPAYTSYVSGDSTGRGTDSIEGDVRAFSPWFARVRNMTGDNLTRRFDRSSHAPPCKTSPAKKTATDRSASEQVFAQRPYFLREASYLDLFLHARIPDRRPGRATTKKGDFPLSVAFWGQARLVRALHRTVAAISCYHQKFPDTGEPRLLLAPILRDAVGIERAFEQLSTLSGKASPSKDMIKKKKHMIKKKLNLWLADIRVSQSRLIGCLKASAPGPCPPPVGGANAWPTGGGHKPPDDTLKQLEGQIANRRAVWPPYFVFLIAEGYGALGNRDAGLKIIARWQAYLTKWQNARSHRPDETAAAIWFLHRSQGEYGIVEEADEPYPTSLAELFYLRRLAPKLRDDLQAIRRRPCAASAIVRVRRFGRVFPVGSCEHAGVCGVPPMASDACGAAVQLREIYEDVVQRFLIARLANLPLRGPSRMNPTDANLAAREIRNARRCLRDEPKAGCDYRRATDLMAGGMALGTWAEVGWKLGELPAFAAARDRRTALRALLTAWPLVVNQAANHPRQPPSRSAPNFWAYDRPVLERAILDLERRLAR